MASANITYRVETTTFPGPDAKIENYTEANGVAIFARALPVADRVLFVAALDTVERVDYGNFYLFTNAAGSAHVMLHEHREFLPRDPVAPDEEGEVTFLDEEGHKFSVPHAMTTSHQRGVAALEYWLPRQEQWPEFQWE
jgi:hypothetical protein